MLNKVTRDIPPQCRARGDFAKTVNQLGCENGEDDSTSNGARHQTEWCLDLFLVKITQQLR